MIGFILLLILIVVIVLIIGYYLFKRNLSEYGIFSTTLTECMNNNKSCKIKGTRIRTRKCNINPNTGIGCWDNKLKEVVYTTQKTLEECNIRCVKSKFITESTECKSYSRKQLSNINKYVEYFDKLNLEYPISDEVCSINRFKLTKYTCVNTDDIDGSNDCKVVDPVTFNTRILNVGEWYKVYTGCNKIVKCSTLVCDKSMLLNVIKTKETYNPGELYKEFITLECKIGDINQLTGYKDIIKFIGSKNRDDRRALTFKQSSNPLIEHYSPVIVEFGKQYCLKIGRIGIDKYKYGDIRDNVKNKLLRMIVTDIDYNPISIYSSDRKIDRFTSSVFDYIEYKSNKITSNMEPMYLSFVPTINVNKYKIAISYRSINGWLTTSKKLIELTSNVTKYSNKQLKSSIQLNKLYYVPGRNMLNRPIELLADTQSSADIFTVDIKMIRVKSFNNPVYLIKNNFIKSVLNVNYILV